MIPNLKKKTYSLLILMILPQKKYLIIYSSNHENPKSPNCLRIVMFPEVEGKGEHIRKNRTEHVFNFNLLSEHVILLQ